MRRDDWEARLYAVELKYRGRKFAWKKRGTWDCAHFACECVKAMTGQDPMKEFRGQYHDEETARQAIDDIGSGTLFMTVAKRFKKIPVGLARRGDLLMVNAEHGPSDARVMGPTILVCFGEYGKAPGEDGLHAIATAECKHAFRVE